MAKNRIQDLRDHLFETLEQLKDKDTPMDVERAKAIVGVSQAIIETARVEVKYMEIVGRDENGREFFDKPQLTDGKTPVTVSSRRTV